MKPLIELEIGFYNETQAYISLISRSADFARLYQDVLLLCSYNLRQMYNIDPHDPICKSLGGTLNNLRNEDAGLPLLLTVAPPNPSLFKINISTRDIGIVKYKEPADKRFSARIDNEGTIVYFTLDHHGFGPLGKGTNYYVPVSIGILLNFIADEHKEDHDYIKVLTYAAHRCGQVVVDKRLNLSSSWPLACEITKTLFAVHGK